MPTFLVRARLPEATSADIRAAVARVADSAGQLRREGFRIHCVHTTYVPADGWLGCLYEADSAVEVKYAVERAVLPFDDIVEATCPGPDAETNPRGENR